MKLKGRVAIVTGGAAGIGKATAITLAHHGAKVVIADLNPLALKGAEEEIKGFKSEVLSIKTDISKEEDVLNLMNTVHRHWGAIDILVNNAGIVATKSIEELSLEEWNNTLSINLTGTFLCCKYALRFMKSRRYGKIINMGSLAGQSGGIMVGADYSASKGGIIAFTKTVAREAAPYNINVNVVSPGTISTGGIDSFHDEGLKSIKALIPLGRLGKVEDVAQLILFLVSEEADFITGATFDINGGLLMR
ncbi:MAG: SDR family NAD(P)-dependent oxidoreductase [Mahellales bacterium]|jgi:3-oxoacyl-[acyl-carrier protein] reductase